MAKFPEWPRQRHKRAILQRECEMRPAGFRPGILRALCQGLPARRSPKGLT